MTVKETYMQKFSRIVEQTQFNALPNKEQAFIREKAFQYQFTLQELRQITEIALDFSIWEEPSIIDVWATDLLVGLTNREAKKLALRSLRERWTTLKSAAKSYRTFNLSTKPTTFKLELTKRSKDKLGIGSCPVASMKTRCCNVLTLDAVENCGFDCSYCSIRSFYHGNRIYFDNQFADKLNALTLDSNRIYHIGTGQSSDSLMWGNKHGILDALIEFARKHPNVILELKTKSKNIAYFLKNEVPKNILCTWSLNTQTIITHEEHLTASLEERLKAARSVADHGVIVGFHFHPMVHYEHWQRDYGNIFHTLLTMFHPSEVAMISMGTLTFIKPVIKQIRSRKLKSKILQMPLVECDGKLSYPDDIKRELFSFAHKSLDRWHDQVYFYLCMENHRLWKSVLGFEYQSNEEFENAMKQSYRLKTG